MPNHNRSPSLSPPISSLASSATQRDSQGGVAHSSAASNGATSHQTGSPTSPTTPGAAGVGKRYRSQPAKTFQCRGYGECRMVFSRSEHLARHVRLVCVAMQLWRLLTPRYSKHTGERPFTCHCSKQFSRLDNLRQHAQTVHADKADQNEAMMRDLSSLHSALAVNKGKRRSHAGASAAAAAAANAAPASGQQSAHHTPLDSPTEGHSPQSIPPTPKETSYAVPSYAHHQQHYSSGTSLPPIPSYHHAQSTHSYQHPTPVYSHPSLPHPLPHIAAGRLSIGGYSHSGQRSPFELAHSSSHGHPHHPSLPLPLQRFSHSGHPQFPRTESPVSPLMPPSSNHQGGFPHHHGGGNSPYSGGSPPGFTPLHQAAQTPSPPPPGSTTATSMTSVPSPVEKQESGADELPDSPRYELKGGPGQSSQATNSNGGGSSSGMYPLSFVQRRDRVLML
jgi:hypothetical protein